MESQPRRILLTGISGMLGRSLARRLADVGCSVLGIDVAPSVVDHPSVELAIADVRDVHRLYRTLESSPPIDVIVHGGGISGSMVMRDNPAQVIDINVVGTTNLLEAARLRRIPRFIQCSTIMVYGPVSTAPVVEDRALAPVNVYGATKVACEALVQSYASEFSLSAALLRIAHVYGPARATYCPVRAMIMGALRREPVTISDSPETRRQLIYSDDVVRAIEIAAFDQRVGCMVANVAPGADWSMEEVAEIVRNQIGPVSVSFGRGGPSSDYLTAPLSNSRAREAWGWVPEIDLPSGIISFAAAIGTKLR